MTTKKTTTKPKGIGYFYDISESPRDPMIAIEELCYISKLDAVESADEVAEAGEGFYIYEFKVTKMWKYSPKTRQETEIKV